MKRLFKIGAGSLMATSLLAGTMALVGPGAASATTSSRHLSRAPVAMACSTSRSYALPKTHLVVPGRSGRNGKGSHRKFGDDQGGNRACGQGLACRDRFVCG